MDDITPGPEGSAQGRLRKRFEGIVARVGEVVLGKETQVELALTCLFARGHLLIEDLPGIGKTTLAKVLARILGLGFRRVQFTSDMLPGDVLGTSVYEQKRGVFVFHPGPIFTQVLLADEINRTTPKTQSALLEAMEESQVTIEGKTRPLDDPFFVIATQNPLEQIGTFPLPESQLDRFLMSIDLGYPGREGEKRLLRKGGAAERLGGVAAALTREDVLRIQGAVMRVTAADALLEYLQDILEFTRGGPYFHLGLSPRAGLALLQAARAWSFLHGRAHVLPEDLQAVFPWVAGHRLRRRTDLHTLPRSRLMEMLAEIPVPEEIERPGTERVSSGKAVLRDDGRGVPPAQLLGQPIRFLAVPLVPEELVNVEQALAADQTLDAHPLMALQQVCQQIHFQAIARRKIRMPPFRRKRPVPPPVPEKADLAQPRARGDDSLISQGVRSPRIDDRPVGGPKDGNPMGAGFPVVDQAYLRKRELPCQLAGVDHPGQVGGFAAAPADRPGHPEGGQGHGMLPGCQKFFQGALETRLLAAREGLLGDEDETPLHPLQDRQAGVGPADVPGKDSLSLPFAHLHPLP